MLPTRESIITARDAGASFIAGAGQGWGRRELASWLVGQYAPCTVRGGDDRLQSECRRPHIVRDDVVANIVDDARQRALALLTELRDPLRAAAIARVMIAARFVTSVPDARGAGAYMPVARGRMKLSERVASLFVADCLNSPFDYRWVYVCGQCSSVSFGSSVLCCAPRRRDSEIRFASLVRTLASGGSGGAPPSEVSRASA